MSRRIILDYYRRWAWILGLAAAGEFGLGWLIGLNPQGPFEFFAFLVSLWSGATMLSFDFRRGALRPIVVLPVTGSQIGRSWWIATVPVPACALAVLLFSGGALQYYLGPGRGFPVQRLVLSSLFTLVWLGVGFTMVFNSTRTAPGTMREFASSMVVSWMTIATFFGSMILCVNASHSLVRTSLLLLFGGILTVIGWVRANEFDPARAGLCLGRLDAPNLARSHGDLTLQERRSLPLDVCIPRGVGGIPFLLSRTCFRTSAILSAMVLLMAVCYQLQRLLLIAPQMDLVVLAVPGGFIVCWFTLFHRFIPALHHLSYLRTLPVPSFRLAAALLTLALLPPVALAVLAPAAVWLVSGSAAAIVVVNSFLFPIAATAICVGVASWCGAGTRSQAFLFVILFGALMAKFWVQAHFHFAEPPVIWGARILLACLALAFFLTWSALAFGSRAYHFHGTSIALPWGAGR